jgi:hypothetical protein
MRETEQTWIELLLSEPEIVAWLEPDEPEADDDGDPPRAARRILPRTLPSTRVLSGTWPR